MENNHNMERLAKRIARAGLCSRREAEVWINEGRVQVGGKTIKTPAFNVSPTDAVKVDGKLLRAKEETRLWLYHKPTGLVTTHKDPENRPTVFDALPTSLGRVISIGRLDLNSEGLLLLTNDGGLARQLELPSTGWIRRYRVRVFGGITPAMLAQMKKGVTIDGLNYGGIDTTIDSRKKDNSWLTVALKEGKNREIRNIFEHFGCKVSRLMRLSYGPFQLGSLPRGEVKEVSGKVLKSFIGR
ncbi:MAG: rRNA pseudouridine synthase [Pseudomonadota bacterium]|nr:rRNA pseudouridine synthase [Pseudomonadota bacterium]MDE3036828.1 rRNA pseudouridine synthase [Pseudomonadota bacterium]